MSGEKEEIPKLFRKVLQRRLEDTQRRLGF